MACTIRFEIEFQKNQCNQGVSVVMTDRRMHRGAHPEDPRLFDEKAIGRLRAAAADYCWLLSRGYTGTSSLKLVGDRFELTSRQRMALLRCCCSDEALTCRKSREVGREALEGSRVRIDGFNLILTVEAALGHGVLLTGRDGCLRDLSSVHGSYRKVQETLQAMTAIGETLDQLAVVDVMWLLDRPVSNSGRLRSIILELARDRGWRWSVELEMNPDRCLVEPGPVVITSDGAILERTERWYNLARRAIEEHVPGAWRVDLFTAG